MNAVRAGYGRAPTWAPVTNSVPSPPREWGSISPPRRTQRFFANIVPRHRAAPHRHGYRRFAVGVCRSSSTNA